MQHLQQSKIPLGADIAGIDHLDLFIGRAGFVEPVKIAQRHRLVVERVDKIRPKRDRPIEPGQRVFLAAEQLQGDGHAVAAVGIAGIKRVRPLIDGDDLLELPQAQHAFGADHQRGNVVRARLEAWLENVERFLQPAGFASRAPLSCAASQCRGLKIEHVPERQQRLVAPSLLPQRLSKAEEIFRLDGLLHRSGDPLHGVIELAGVEQQQAHQMQAVGVPVIDRKCLLAAQLRFERLPGAPVSESRLIQRVRRLAIRAARLCLGFACRGTAFVTIHCGRLAETSASNSLRTRSSTLA